MKKKIFAFLLFLIMILSFSSQKVFAESAMDGIVKEQLQQVNTQKIEQFWDKLMKQYGGFFPENQKSLFDLVMPGNDFKFQSFFIGLIKYIFYEILYNSKLIGSIILLTVFSTVLQNIQTTFEQSTVSKVAFYVSYLVMMIIAINSFTVAINSAKDSIQEMISFMIALIPLVLALVASSGGIVSASMFHPFIIFLIHVIGTVIYKMIFPLIFFSAVLSIVSKISEKYQVSQLAKLLRNISIGALGIFSTIFLGVISVQGATAAVADGVTLRTAKYITGNFVPVVGKMFADATDTVVGASLLVKNAVGMAGVLILLLIVIFPSIKILTLAFIYNFSSAIMQPLGDNPMIDTLNMIGKNLMFVFAALATVCLMFFLALTIIISAGNITVMLR
ncbi:stage III sporulation protein AE [Tepidibacillus fermentans]|uniref:Stage III sporulation protein AE n=1 Tax=Tepidibacillus fermentans TaxID=1281767 RepID=A0A4R3KK82_9BACI|nr:stage III sporulation protein AE [Tepidibacillus fermentans]TCS84027.1 stage III sporulation protein AE [Tepidibacillus fermentans]